MFLGAATTAIEEEASYSIKGDALLYRCSPWFYCILLLRLVEPGFTRGGCSPPPPVERISFFCFLFPQFLGLLCTPRPPSPEEQNFQNAHQPTSYFWLHNLSFCHHSLSSRSTLSNFFFCSILIVSGGGQSHHLWFN